MDHGDHAQIGDLVELIYPGMIGAGPIKLVLGVQNKRTPLGDTEKYLYLEMQDLIRKEFWEEENNYAPENLLYF